MSDIRTLHVDEKVMNRSLSDVLADPIPFPVLEKVSQMQNKQIEYVSIERAIPMRRVWAMPNKYTFKVAPIEGLLRTQVNGRWADPFSGFYSPATLRNDADETRRADFHLDGLAFLRLQSDDSLDGVLFDPPYSTEQALRKYKPVQGGTAGRAEYWAKCKDEIARIVKPNGKAICFGWDSTGIGEQRGFQLEQMLVVCHGACHNDTICTVERKVESGQSELF